VPPPTSCKVGGRHPHPRNDGLLLLLLRRLLLRHVRSHLLSTSCRTVVHRGRAPTSSFSWPPSSSSSAHPLFKPLLRPHRLTAEMLGLVRPLALVMQKIDVELGSEVTLSPPFSSTPEKTPES